jgi:branched-subunit amino acid transport protein
VNRWLVLGGLAAGTYLLRLSFLALFGRLEGVPPRVERLLRFVPPAALAALAAPGFLAPAGALALGPGNERLLAGLVAGVVAWRTESIFVTIAVGMAALWALAALP